MARDSRLWEQAYASYEKYVPNSNHNLRHRSAGPVRKRDREPMQLLEEYRSIVKQIQALTKRRKAIQKQMQERGHDPAGYMRSSYFDRPILLYVLRLQDNCWYIGMSRNVDRRFKAHQKGKTIWTKQHPPIEVAEVRETGLTSDSEASRLEDELTLEYARQYGVDRVRGGGYCQRKPIWPPELSEPDLSWIR